MDARVGDTIAGYRLEAEIGRGGMGVVYLAADDRLDRRVAVKLLSPDMARDERFRERFLRESRLAATIEHPNVVPVHDAGEADGVLYLVMRHVAGTDLGSYLRANGPLPIDRAVAVVAQAAAALDAAHARGLVHRDVKPANILLDGDHVYLCDFGLTKAAASISGLTATGQLIGTIDYVAPEQFEGRAVDGRSDIYSLGCVAYECLTGTPPFRRDNELATLWAHAHEPPPSPAAARPGVPAQMDAAVRRAMAKAPEERFGSGAEMVAALRAPGRPARRDRRVLGVAAGVVAVAAIAAGVILHASGGGGGAVTVVPNSVAVIDPATQRIVADVAAGSAPSDVVAGGGYVWALSAGDQTVTRIDPRTHATRTFSTLRPPTDLAFGFGSLWVAAGHDDVLIRVQPDDPGSQLLIHVPPAAAVGEGFSSVATGMGGVFVLNSDTTVSRVDPTTGDVVKRSPTEGNGAFDSIAAGSGGVWVSGANVEQFDAASLQSVLATVPAPSDECGIAAGGGWVWVCDASGSTVWRISPGPPVRLDRTVDVGARPTSVAFGAGAAWVPAGDGTVTRVDTKTAQATTITVGGTPASAAVGDGMIWVAVD
jgi:Protein kinase domain